MTFWQKLWSLFNIKVHLQLNKLRTAEVRAAETLKKIEKQQEELRKARIEANKLAILAQEKVKKTQDTIQQTTDAILDSGEILDEKVALLEKAKETAAEEELKKLEDEVKKYEVTIDRLAKLLSSTEIVKDEQERTFKMRQGDVNRIEEQSLIFVHQSDRAKQVIEISRARYESAKAALRTNQGRLTPEILKEIKELEELAMDVSATAEATRIVNDSDAQSDIESVKASISMTQQGDGKKRLAELRAKKAK